MTVSYTRVTRTYYDATGSLVTDGHAPVIRPSLPLTDGVSKTLVQTEVKCSIVNGVLTGPDGNPGVLLADLDTVSPSNVVYYINGEPGIGAWSFTVSSADGGTVDLATKQPTVPGPAIALFAEGATGPAGPYPAYLAINEQTGTSYTLVLSDGNGDTLVECTNASTITLTVPPNSSVAFPVGTVIPISQGGAGQIVVTAGSGVTLRTPNGAKAAQQWSQIAITQRAANDWIVSGDTST